eukprot:6293067-Prymnesium_polylepis.1
MARLPPTPDRSAKRSRTYIGIASAMALQWMPVLIAYLTSVPASETRPTAAELLRRAELTPHRLAQV